MRKCMAGLFLVPKGSFYRLSVHIFGHEGHFAWQGKSSFGVLKRELRDLARVRHRGKRSVLWALPKRWQA